MLELKSVSKTFNLGTANELKALDGLNLTVTEGEFITVVGGNGSGKSTMLNAVAGVFPIDTGNIIIDGVDVTNMPAYKRAKYIGRVFQDPMVGSASSMSIEDNLAFASRRGKIRTLKWRITQKEREAYKEALSQLGLNLENRLADRVGLLSGGQRQALTLLMATLSKPNILLLDEHTAALDPKTAKMVISLSEMLVLKHKMTTLMVTHNMSDALRYGTRVIMMGQGKVVYEAQGEKKEKLTTTEMVEMFSL
ncbi:MAG: ATP-binding cassette domain-containing protein [Clostridiales bacterium]|jgi:putative ABC transport system ATP-binding protein|nr:ATP-binding cassette domain-containing protein [Clostridiales bacterium]